MNSVSQGWMQCAKVFGDRTERHSASNQWLKLLPREPAARGVLLAAVCHQAVFFHPVADGGRIAIHERADLFQRELLRQVPSQKIPLHEPNPRKRIGRKSERAFPSHAAKAGPRPPAPLPSWARRRGRSGGAVSEPWPPVKRRQGDRSLRPFHRPVRGAALSE